MSRAALNWQTDGRDWPNREASEFVSAAGLLWHVQRMGQGPPVLLLHGTGAATHSWRDLAPLLARRFTLLAPDLPGHGFTAQPPPDGLSLPGMAEAVAGLLEAVGVSPELAIGHSAGAAILARMSLDGSIAPRTLVSLNGALLPLSGVPGRMFSPIAKIFATTPLASRIFAWRASDPSVVERLLRGTGSNLDPAGAALYGRLASNPCHAAAALGMMARWDLRPLARDLPRLDPRLVLVVGTNDRSIPPASAYRVHALVPGSKLVRLRGLGHLAHEEAPEQIAEIVVEESEGSAESARAEESAPKAC